VWSPKVTNKKSKKRNRYTEQFRAEAVRAVETRGNRTIAEVAEGLGVAEHMLHAWKARAKQQPVADGDRGETLEQEVRRLRRENSDLKKDRDVLVKSIAVFAKERK
jgi:transposase